ncbi:MAG: hypothetical protein VB853_00035 [Pirellulales bacterium]
MCGGDRFKLIREWNGHCGGYHTYSLCGHSLGRALEVAGFEALSSPNRNRPLDDLLALRGRQVGEPSVATSKAA